MHAIKPPKNAAIIGAGIAGCSTAFALAKRGVKVTLYERNSQVATQASGNPIGMLYPRISGDNHASHFALAAYRYSLNFYQTLNLKADIFKACGMLQLGSNPRELARIQKVAQLIDPNIAHLISANAASKIAGILCQHPALYFKDAAWIKPQLICQHLVQHENIHISNNCHINAIRKVNDAFEIYSQDQLINKFDIVIIANANAAKEISQTAHLNMDAVRGQITQVQSTPSTELVKMIICSDGYFSPAINGHHTLGATFALNDTNINVTQQDHLANLSKLKNISAALLKTLEHNIIAGKTAFRCVAKDHFSMVGELLDANILTKHCPRPTALKQSLPWISGCYVNLAHGSHGFINAPLAAEILTSLIFNTALPIEKSLVECLNPNRFLLRELGLKKLAKTVATSKP